MTLAEWAAHLAAAYRTREATEDHQGRPPRDVDVVLYVVDALIEGTHPGTLAVLELVDRERALRGLS